MSSGDKERELSMETIVCMSGVGVADHRRAITFHSLRFAWHSRQWVRWTSAIRSTDMS